MNSQILPLAATLLALIFGFIVFKAFSSKRQRKVLSKEFFQEFPLIQRTVLSHNSGIYRFALPKESDILGLPIGQHIQITANINGKDIVRSYTPTSNDAQQGYFDLLIKHYPQGNISKHIHELEIGQTIKVKGPKGFFEYTPNMVTHFGMVAGGTGITPMYQIINAIANNPEDNTKVELLYGNQTEEDILLRAELDELATKYPNQFKIHYFLDKPPQVWEGFTGYITFDYLNKLLPAAAPKTQILICGPPPMVNNAKKHAHTLGFQKAKPVSKAGDQIFVF